MVGSGSGLRLAGSGQSCGGLRFRLGIAIHCLDHFGKLCIEALDLFDGLRGRRRFALDVLLELMRALRKLLLAELAQALAAQKSAVASRPQPTPQPAFCQTLRLWPWLVLRRQGR